MICNTYKVFFDSLADPTRLELIKLLRERSRSVTELSTETGFEQSRVSHSLRKLKEFGFVTVTPRGKQRIYHIHEAVEPLLKLIDKHVDTYYRHYCRCIGIEKEKRWQEVTT